MQPLLLFSSISHSLAHLFCKVTCSTSVHFAVQTSVRFAYHVHSLSPHLLPEGRNCTVLALSLGSMSDLITVNMKVCSPNKAINAYVNSFSQSMNWNFILIFSETDQKNCFLLSCKWNVHFISPTIKGDRKKKKLAQTGIKISRRNINYLRYADDTTLMAESEDKPQSLWRMWKKRVKELA